MFSTFIKLSAISLVIMPFMLNAKQVLSLAQALIIAQQNDPWLHGSKLQQQALESRSLAVNTLPAPTVSLGMLNVATDSWNLDQEAMTQMKVGIAQMFPRGDSLAIKAEQLATSAKQHPLLRADRQANIKTTVTQLWLDAYLAQATIVLIKKDWLLFEQMAEIAKARYASAVGQTRQQDVIRAQLEIIQLQDKLTIAEQNYATAMARLNQWLQPYRESELTEQVNFNQLTPTLNISDELPNIGLVNQQVLETNRYTRNELAHLIASHPKIQAMNVKQQIAKQSILLNKEQNAPQWGVNASYSYRDDDPLGNQRADLFSVAITFDLPLFTQGKQDKNIAAAVAESEAVKTEKLLLLKEMLTGVEKEVAHLHGLLTRQTLYKQQLLTQSHEQAEAALTAYTNDDGDFAEVVRARIAELNVRIATLEIEINSLKTIARINYYFTATSHNALSTW